MGALIQRVSTGMQENILCMYKITGQWQKNVEGFHQALPEVLIIGKASGKVKGVPSQIHAAKRKTSRSMSGKGTGICEGLNEADLSGKLELHRYPVHQS